MLSKLPPRERQIVDILYERGALAVADVCEALTAAHVAQVIGPFERVVRVAGRECVVSEIYTHQGYDGSTAGTDIALLAVAVVTVPAGMLLADGNWPQWRIDREIVFNTAPTGTASVSTASRNGLMLPVRFSPTIFPAASKYSIFAMVNGLQTFAIYFSHVFSPTRAIRSMWLHSTVENLMSSHRACMSQP